MAQYVLGQKHCFKPLFFCSGLELGGPECLVEAIQLVGSLGCPCRPFLQAAPHHLAQYRSAGLA
jgi:hypothetical protein